MPFIDQLFIPETPEAVRTEVRQGILATPQHVLASCMENFAEDPRMFTPEVLDVPAFAIFCAFWHPERFVDIFKRYLPRLEYEELQGSGHYLMLEKPEETNAALLRFSGKLRDELQSNLRGTEVGAIRINTTTVVVGGERDTLGCKR